MIQVCRVGLNLSIYRHRLLLNRRAITSVKCLRKVCLHFAFIVWIRIQDGVSAHLYRWNVDHFLLRLMLLNGYRYGIAAAAPCILPLCACWDLLSIFCGVEASIHGSTRLNCAGWLHYLLLNILLYLWQLVMVVKLLRLLRRHHDLYIKFKIL